MECCKKDHVRFYVFAEEDKKSDWENSRLIAIKEFQSTIPDNIELNWGCVSDNHSGFLHERVLFTGKGGIRYDRGFEEPNDIGQRETPTKVSPVSSKALIQNSEDYNKTQSSKNVVLVRKIWSSKNGYL
ncbi:hypothetical protein CI610_02497 [invertebrate metagenome]|uniref:Uncharacterized protein n=1 Tax=invertebrate metagenome TaxID=1711999 RepID=A0A2H9T5S5_9ZZZZ